MEQSQDLAKALRDLADEIDDLPVHHWKIDRYADVKEQLGFGGDVVGREITGQNISIEIKTGA
jgi:hypothetical protein